MTRPNEQRYSKLHFICEYKYEDEVNMRLLPIPKIKMGIFLKPYSINFTTYIDIYAIEHTSLKSKKIFKEREI